MRTLKILLIGNYISPHFQSVYLSLVKFGHVCIILPDKDRENNYLEISELNKDEYKGFYRNNLLKPLYISKNNKILKILCCLIYGRYILKKYSRDVDVINLQSGNFLLGLSIFGLKVPNLIVSFWGGELWEDLPFPSNILQRVVLRKAKIITVPTIDAKKKALVKYKFLKEENIFVKKFNTPKFNLIDELTVQDTNNFKKKMGIESNIVITYSYASDERHRQDYFIKLIENIDNNFLREKNVVFLLPLGYGNSLWRKKIINLANSSLKKEFIKIIDYYQSDKDVCLLRKATDVFINIPAEDSFSASMFEHFYAGNIVITGEWLPYCELFNSSIFFIKLPNLSIEFFKDILINTINDLENLKLKCRQNKELVLNLFYKEDLTWEEIFNKLL